MVLRLRGSDAGSATANDAVTFYRLASDGNTDAVEVMHWQSYRSSLVRYVSLRGHCCLVRLNQVAFPDLGACLKSVRAVMSAFPEKGTVELLYGIPGTTVHS